MEKDIIYIGDLSYKKEGTPFPLGVGYISSMIDFYFDNTIDTVIFTDPLELISALKKKQPKIVALANYSWNSNINSQIIKYSKKISNEIITVLGGPFFAKNDKIWLKKYFEDNRDLDFYVSGEGEWKFIELVKQARKHSYSMKSMLNELSPDIFYKNKNGEVLQGTIPLQEVLDHRYKDTRKKDLDIIKSPYLTGRLDQFFEVEDMVPMIETVRGCPYGCTFCCWGDPSLSRLSAFSEERVYNELDYIAKRSEKFNRLIIADGNFGILKRDILLANHLNKLNHKYGWPKSIYLYFAKNSNDNIVKIASVLGKMIKVSLARQTMNEDVLKNIKRKNINDETFYKVQKQLSVSNIDSMIEFIYPLPGETKNTFATGINELFKKLDILHTEIRFYPTELLPGSEMATNESREKFGIKSAWRKLYGSDKNFGEVKGCEFQEIITSTKTFSLSDFIYVRKLHFLICLFATYKIYQPIVELYQNKFHENSFVWFIDKLILAMETKSGLIAELFKEITSEIKNELKTEEEYNKIKNSLHSDGGRSKRINIYYILTLLYGKEGKYRKEFSKLIKDVLIENSLSDVEEIDKKIREIDSNLIDFNEVKKTFKTNNAVEQLSIIPNNIIISEFAKCYNGNLIETLDKMYDLSSAGHLGMLVLKKHSRSEKKLDPLLKVSSQIATTQ